MKNIPTITSPVLDFNVTILGSVVPVTQSQNYTVSSAPLVITYDPFQVLPADFNVGPSSVSAYIYKGSELPDPIDFSCNCLTEVTELDWILFDSAANTLTIQTSDINLVGVHTVGLL